MGTFPNSPSVDDTTTIGSKTFKWTGYAWTQEVSGSSGSSGGASATGAPYVYTSGSSLANASSNGEFFHSTSNNTISINQNDNDGDSFANALNGTLTTTGRIGVIFGDSTIERNFYYDSVTLFSGSYTFTATGILPNISTGSGKTVTINVYADAPAQAASEYFRFPDGTQAASIVTSFNGLTGDVTGVSSFNAETGAVTFDQVTPKTYDVTVANAGGNKYFIDTVQQDTIYLLRGQKYVFSLAGSVSGHPFRFQTDSGAGYSGATEYTTGVVNAGADSGDITFTVPYNAPNTLYYRCEYHSGMGGQVTIKNLTPNDLEGPTGPKGDTGEQGDTGANGTSVGFTSGNTAPSGSNTGDFWYENDTGLYYANVYDGSTLAWLQVSGRPGTTGEQGSAGQDGAGGGGATLAAGAGVTLSSIVAGVGYTLGIDPTAVIHVAGVSSDGGITLGGEYLRWSSNDSIRSVGGVFRFSASNTNVLNMTPSMLDMKTNMNVEGLAHFEAGISSDIGITCGGMIQGQHLTIAGDGNFGTGSRLKSPNSHQIYFATNYVNISTYGSASRGINVGYSTTSVESAHTLVTKGPGISMDAGGITFADGTFQSSAASGSGGVTGADGTSVGYTAGNTAPVGSATGDFWYENDTGLYYANVFDGTTLGWLQISGIDGVTGPIGPTGSGGGGGGATYYGGDGLTLSTGNTFSIDPTAIVHVAGISSDGGITASGFNVTSNTNGYFGLGSADTRLYVSTSNAMKMRLVNTIYYEFGISEFSSYATKNTFHNLVHAKAGISMDAAGITFADGTFQSSAASGSTITAGAGMTLTGSTLGIDPTAAIHVAGISSDGGITAAGNIATDNFRGVNSATVIEMDRGGAGAGTIGFNPGGNFAAQFTPTTFYHGGNLTNEGTGRFNQLLTAAKGISLDASGITFADGTFQSTAPTGSSTVTASYSGHLESAIMKTYYIDPRVPVGRTVTEFYAICGTGGCSAEIGGQNGSISTISISPTGVTGSLANTTLPVGGTLDMTLSNVVGCFDLRFAVRYTQ